MNVPQAALDFFGGLALLLLWLGNSGRTSFCHVRMGIAPSHVQVYEVAWGSSLVTAWVSNGPSIKTEYGFESVGLYPSVLLYHTNVLR